MKKIIALLCAVALSTTVDAQVPNLINYQGRIAVGTVNFNGSGQFKFALVNTDGSATYWSNDGTSTAGSQPTTAVSLTVTKGLYSVLLGDAALTNMTAVPASVFNNSDVRLRVWFNDGTNGFQQLTPDQRIAAVGYAMVAGGVNLPATTSSSIGTISQNGQPLLHTFGTNNVFVGSLGGGFTATGSTNTAVGATAFQFNTSGGSNMASGAFALRFNTTGSVNTAEGAYALYSNTTGWNNTATGSDALRSNTSGNSNIAVGVGAGRNLTTGSDNIDIGHQGVAGESAIIRIGTTGTHTDTYLTGVIHGNGSGLTGVSASIGAGAITSTLLASSLSLSGTTTGTFSGPLTGNVTGNVTGSAASFTGSLAGEVTGTQSATAISAAVVTGKALTGLSSVAGTVTSADSILAAIGKLNGNVALKAPIASPTFTGTVTAPTISGNLTLPPTTSSSAGVISQNGISLIQAYGSGNFFAADSGNFTMTGFANTSVGVSNLRFNTTGYQNSAFGANALNRNTTGAVNTAVGQTALSANTTGSNNTAIGSRAGDLLTTGSNNIDIGNEGVAGESGTVRIGTSGTHLHTYLSGVVHGDGSGLTGVGASTFAGTLAGDVTGTQGATAVSTVGGVSASSIANATSVVAAATESSTNGTIVKRGTTGRVAIATIDLPISASGLFHPAGALLQDGSRLLHTFGVGNLFVGKDAGNLGMTGIDNTGLGREALRDNTSGSGNAALGSYALTLNTTGSDNTALGAGALDNNISGTQNTAVGGSSLVSNHGSENTAVGYRALFFNDQGSGNVAIGHNALYWNTAVGNTATGKDALYNNGGDYNTAHGYTALHSNLSGVTNTAFGYYSLFANETGNANTALGSYALKDNISGTFNIAIGQSAGQAITTGTHNICIDNYGIAGDTLTTRIGTSQTRVFISGIRSATTGVNNAQTVMIDGNGQLGTVSSSRRYKENIADMKNASARLLSLRPVTFRYKKPFANGEKPVQFGLIAEEVAETFPELTVFNAEGEPESVKYQDLAPMLLNEFLKEHKRAGTSEACQEREIKALQAENAAMRDENAVMKKRLADLEAMDREREARLAKLEQLIPAAPKSVVTTAANVKAD